MNQFLLLLVALLMLPSLAAAEVPCWTLDSMSTVTPDTVAPADLKPIAAQIDLARNEAESFQIVLRSEKAPLKNIRLDTTGFPLKTRWFLVGYIKAKTKRYADLLLPVKQFEAPAGVTCSIYVTVQSDAETPAGDYTGKIKLLADGQEPRGIEVRATVYDFVLPVGPGRCRTAFALQVAREYVPGEYVRYADFMLDHRLNPDDIYRNWTPRVAELEHYLERGLNYFTILKVSGAAQAPQLRQFYNELAKSRQGEALAKMGYVYGYDERPKAKWDEMGEGFGALKKEFPQVKTFTTAHLYMDWGGGNPVEAMKKYHVDVIAPWIHPGYPEYYHYDDGVKLRAAGLEYWGYNINFQTHYPLIQSRTTFWEMYHLQADGWLYYCVNGWEKEDPLIDPEKGPMVDYDPKSNSQAQLIYRGKDGPISSLRMEAVRDGIEDWLCLDLLAQKLKDVEAARKACSKVAWGPLKWTSDPQVVLATRREIAKQLAAK